jgi:proteasome assembly chaperone (PAC2) family protein
MDTDKLNRPWLVAVWPGMGHVALSAGFYLMSKLGMHQLAEYSATDLFDVDFAVVHKGRIQPTQRPRSRFFVWKAPEGKRDIVVFIGEAQPPMGKYSFCEKLIDFARDLGVERIFTFAAMATEMRPDHECRVFAAGTDDESVRELDEPSLHLLDEGHIGGLNGVLLCVAADKGMQGVCLLGEMPHVFAQLPFPNASLAVLRAFLEMAGVPLDLAELEQQGKIMEEKLTEIVKDHEARMEQREPHDQEDEFTPAPTEERLSEEDEQHIENLFREASADRSKAYELKSELDRLDIFKDYEDRFLDLFKNEG